MKFLFLLFLLTFPHSDLRVRAVAAQTSTGPVVLLAWNPSTTPGVVYHLWRAQRPIPPKHYGVSTGTKLTFTDKNVLSGHTYYYWVTAYELVESPKDGPAVVTIP